MIRRQFLGSLVVLASPTIGSVALAAGTPRELLEAAHEQKRVPSMRVELQMNISDGSREWTRTAELFSRQLSARQQRQLFTFKTPPDLAGSAVLTREEPSEQAAQWVYIPAYHTARRIAVANKGEAYLGTDYFYEDVLDPNWDEYALSEVGVDGAVHRIEATPAADALRQSSAYSRTVYSVDAARRVITKQEHFDKQGKLLKRLTNAAAKTYGRFLLWDAAVMENVQTGHKTISQVLRREVEAAIDDDVFTVKALKRNR